MNRLGIKPVSIRGIRTYKKFEITREYISIQKKEFFKRGGEVTVLEPAPDLSSSLFMYLDANFVEED